MHAASSGIGKASMRVARIWSDNTTTGVEYSRAMRAASIAVWKQSPTLRAASTGRGESPWLPQMACSKSLCSTCVGMPVDGPPRWTLTTTSGISAMVAKPMASSFNDMPGPLVLVTARWPPYDMPMAAETAASSSSACRKTPPYFGNSTRSTSMIEVAGVMG